MRDIKVLSEVTDHTDGAGISTAEFFPVFYIVSGGIVGGFMFNLKKQNTDINSWSSEQRQIHIEALSYTPNVDS